MYPVTVLGQSAWLIPFGPNTPDPVSIKAAIKVDVQRSLTGRQSRRPGARLLRYTQSWNSVMPMADFNLSRQAFATMQDEPVLVPFWPASCLASSASMLTGGLVIAWTDGWATYAINPGSLAAYQYQAPLIWGRLTQPPRLVSKTPGYALAEWILAEDAPIAAAIQAPTGTDTMFDTVSGFAAALFPWTPEGTEPPKPGFASGEVERKQQGPGRQQTSMFYPQTPEAALQATCKFSCAADALALLGWWQRRGGQSDPLWLPMSQKVGDLAADPTLGTDTLLFKKTAAINVGDTIALFGAGTNPELLRAESVTDYATNVTTTTNIQVDRAAVCTVVAPAILARHTDPELTIDFRRGNKDWVATSVLSFREVAAEYNAPGEETVGTTMGRLAPKAWLYQVDLDYCGAIQSTFLTSFESGCTTPGGQVWTYQDCAFDKVTQSIDLQDDGAKFAVTWAGPGCPWANWLPGQLGATGALTISYATVGSDGTLSAPTQVWKGTLSTPVRKGLFISAKLLGANNLFALLGPLHLMMPTCYKRLYGARCGLLMTDWTFNATVVAVSGVAVSIGSITRANGSALPAGFGFENWFALGSLQWTSGGLPLRSEILASGAQDGSGNITLALGRVLGFGLGAAVTASPGCDKQWTTCQAYDAEANPTGIFGGAAAQRFGSHPFMPAIDPSFIIPQSNNPAAKK